MFTAFIFFAVIGVLVLVHEWGHFIVARRSGMTVEEFGFGFPPRLWGFKRNGVLYSLNWIPFGGFVKILGEDGGHRADPGSFGSKGFWPRIMTIVAGVVMNFVLAVILLIFANYFGLRVGIFDDQTAAIATDKKVQVVQIAAGSPAEKSGLLVLDNIIGFQEGSKTIPVTKESDISDYANAHRGEKVDIVVQRGTEQVVLKDIQARLNPPDGEGAIGISIVATGIVKYPWHESIWRGAYNASIMLVNTAYGYGSLIKTLITDGKLIADVSGPVGIATVTGQAARTGFSYLMQFVALISINLAVLNILPFPALDGGRVVMLVVEKLKGSPIKKEIEGFVNAAGFALLILLMVYVTFKDIAKLFS